MSRKSLSLMSLYWEGKSRRCRNHFCYKIYIQVKCLSYARHYSINVNFSKSLIFVSKCLHMFIFWSYTLFVSLFCVRKLLCLGGTLMLLLAERQKEDSPDFSRACLSLHHSECAFHAGSLCFAWVSSAFFFPKLSLFSFEIKFSSHHFLTFHFNQNVLET